ncbi:hypothetical protein K432DRAFT_397219 [Lepidopterella palustris CBS 459.81]|uniref:C3H1-type domain-containing protein n=1 Tax=Lepidopterella palustris CBS 459.81 TaxID=1314670 RepID=A0A8E2E196_9PEZI|nr:hypothetical protein K432DRAFT_397219 [Lepidopterella palustris CBS 459.81]
MTPPLDSAQLNIIGQNVESMYQECKHVIQQLSQARSKEDELHHENEALRQQIAGLQTRVADADKDRECIEAQLAEYSNLKTENESLYRQLDDARYAIQDLEDAKHGLEDKIESIQSMFTQGISSLATTVRKRSRSPLPPRDQAREPAESTFQNQAKRLRQAHGIAKETEDYRSTPSIRSFEPSYDLFVPPAKDTIDHNPHYTNGHAPVDAHRSGPYRSSLTAANASAPSNNYNGYPTPKPDGTNGADIHNGMNGNRDDAHPHGPYDINSEAGSIKFTSPPDTASDAGVSIRGQAEVSGRSINFVRRRQGLGKIICHNCWEDHMDCTTAPGSKSCFKCLELRIPCTRAVCLGFQKEGKCEKGTRCHNAHDESPLNVIQTQLKFKKFTPRNNQGQAQGK